MNRVNTPVFRGGERGVDVIACFCCANGTEVGSQAPQLLHTQTQNVLNTSIYCQMEYK